METDLTCKTKRISIELSEPLVDKIDNLARKVESSRSELIRRLIPKACLKRIMKKKRALANYEFAKESSREWDFT